MALEIETALIALGGVVIGGSISSFTTLMVHRGERQKFRRERSWELRREAYTSIFGSLDRARDILAYINEAYKDDPHGYDASKERREAQGQMIELFQAARSTFHTNRLMLSKAFVSEYQYMLEQINEASCENLIPPEVAEKTLLAVQTALPRLELLARRELSAEN
ncbi:hypothetical protein [Asticcacaulis sp. 201]|uniref:hypothetical protein n=1 Tax=Asticcacaulis sp. 201 TaxID=3028787 RepID=UPI0029164F7B|nr:hypothetical protein [Asticcacaulis sp. 201]MDV6332388.1 hypothetical protein [Asticcacaulis sp. 201]